MSRYIRPRGPGAPVFFTVALADRRSGLLVEQVTTLREAVSRAMGWSSGPWISPIHRSTAISGGGRSIRNGRVFRLAVISGSRVGVDPPFGGGVGVAGVVGGYWVGCGWV
jgi:hypothetical protein